MCSSVVHWALGTMLSTLLLSSPQFCLLLLFPLHRPKRLRFAPDHMPASGQACTEPQPSTEHVHTLPICTASGSQTAFQRVLSSERCLPAGHRKEPLRGQVGTTLPASSNHARPEVFLMEKLVWVEEYYRKYLLRGSLLNFSFTIGEKKLSPVDLAGLQWKGCRIKSLNSLSRVEGEQGHFRKTGG